MILPIMTEKDIKIRFRKFIQLSLLNVSQCIRIYLTLLAAPSMTRFMASPPAAPNVNSQKFSKNMTFFVLGTYIVIRIGKEYLPTFKSRKAKEKSCPLSAINFKSININFLCVLFRWNQL